MKTYENVYMTHRALSVSAKCQHSTNAAVKLIVEEHCAVCLAICVSSY